jgi:hypothetical protein
MYAFTVGPRKPVPEDGPKGLHKNMMTSLFIITPNRKQSKYLLTGEQLNKIWQIPMEFYPAITGINELAM